MQKRFFKIKSEWVERMSKIQNFNLKDDLVLEYLTAITYRYNSNPSLEIGTETNYGERTEDYFIDENGVLYPKRFINKYYNEIIKE